MNRRSRLLLSVGLFFHVLSGLTSAVAQTTDQPLSISIPAGELADALDSLGEQSGVQIMYEPALAKGITVPAIGGTLSVGDALSRLLAPTGLQATRVNEKTVVLKRSAAQMHAPPSTNEIAAENAPEVAEKKVPMSCRALEQANVPRGEIALATRGARVTRARSLRFTGGSYCLIDGGVQSVDRQAQDIKFEMAFPTRWNGNLIQLGGGGLDGRVVSPREPNGIVAPLNLVARGYLVFGSDSGHEGINDASFALNDEELRNFDGEQLKKTLDVAVYLSNVLYGAKPRHRFFVGGSAGGRESFTAAQKFPKDYDGILSLFPGYELIPLTLKFLMIRRAMEEDGGAGKIGPSEAALVKHAELSVCKTNDAIDDGIIGNPRACQFDFATLRCPKGAPGRDCLSDAQVTTLQLIHSRQNVDASLADGTNRLAAFEIGSDFGEFYGMTASLPDFIRYCILRDADADTSLLDPYRLGNLRARIESLSATYDRASRDVEDFVANGGKWIIVHGLSDELVPPQSSIDYYDDIVMKFGQKKSDAFLRLYLIPGYAHGHGAPFDASYGPFFDALERWVERDESPGRLTIIDKNPAGHGRGRPACVYPALPKYKGSGNADDARSFTCAIS